MATRSPSPTAARSRRRSQPLRTALQGEDVEAIKARTNDLMQAQMKLGEAMYKAQQAAGAAGDAGAAGGGAQAKDDVIDAEFREVDDDKKKP